MSEALDLNTIASMVKKRGLCIPAIFFLELNKPLSNITREAVQCCGPILKLIFGTVFYDSILAVLTSRKQVESLIGILEEDKWE